MTTLATLEVGKSLCKLQIGSDVTTLATLEAGKSLCKLKIGSDVTTLDTLEVSKSTKSSLIAQVGKSNNAVTILIRMRRS